MKMNETLFQKKSRIFEIVGNAFGLMNFTLFYLAYVCVCLFSCIIFGLVWFGLAWLGFRLVLYFDFSLSLSLSFFLSVLLSIEYG